jgi:site-specific recombinase XerD
MASVEALAEGYRKSGLGSISINVRITVVRKLAIEAADNGLLAPELAAGITRIKGVKSKGVRVGNWLSICQAQTLLNTPDVSTKKGLRDRAILAILQGCGLRLLQPYATAADVPGIALRDLRRSRAKKCRAAGGEREQIQLLLGHASVQTTERYLGTKQDVVHAPNDAIRLSVASP